VKKIKILITGGSGFIGTNLVQYLLKMDSTIMNLDVQQPLNREHDRCWVQGDILDKSSLERLFSEYRPTHVVHMAARTDIDEKKSLDGYRVNIQGTENLLRCISKTSSVQRIMVTSSMLVCRLGYAPASDEDYAPSNLYGESKVMTEQITRKFGLSCTWLITRPTTIWGPWSMRYRNEFLSVLRKGFYFHPGNKPVIKTYGYAGNVAYQIHRLLEVPAEVVHGKTFYLGDFPMELRTWVDKFSEGLRGKRAKAAPAWLFHGLAFVGDHLASIGIPFPLTTFRLMNMITSQILDVEKTIKITGQPLYTIDEGVHQTIEWLRNYQEAYPQ
jgi:nucleoside-diphosphate-sugar epimerase